ncbi:MAG: hypothetical protein IPM57_00525 [Oligoflexia bacterium]|nr:hypothetical protein [Oligoflexia bacterium]
MTFKFIFIFLKLISAFGNDVLVTTTPGLNIKQFENAFKELPAKINAKKLKDKMLFEPISSDLKENLFKKISAAEELAQNMEFKRATTLYEEILSILESHPQVAGIEKLTLICFLKLYEYYKAIGDKDLALSFLKKAKAWDLNANLDATVFNKDVREAFYNLKLENKFFVAFSLPKDSEAFLNGKSFKTDKLELFEGKYQVSVLKEGYFWQVKNFFVNSFTKNVVTTPMLEPIIEGSCKKGFKLSPSREITRFSKLIVMTDGCQRVFDGLTWFTMQGEPIVGSVHSATDGLNTDTGSNLANNLKLQLNNSDEPKSFFSDLIGSPWFWAALGAVGIYIFTNQNQAPSVVVPTHSLR